MCVCMCMCMCVHVCACFVRVLCMCVRVYVHVCVYAQSIKCMSVVWMGKHYPLRFLCNYGEAMSYSCLVMKMLQI